MHFMQKHQANTRPTPKLWRWLPKLKTLKAKLATVKSPRQRKPEHSDDAAFCKTKLTALNVQQHWSIEAWSVSATWKLLNIQHFLPNQHQEKLESQIVQFEL